MRGSRGSGGSGGSGSGGSGDVKQPSTPERPPTVALSGMTLSGQAAQGAHALPDELDSKPMYLAEAPRAALGICHLCFQHSTVSVANNQISPPGTTRSPRPARSCIVTTIVLSAGPKQRGNKRTAGVARIADAGPAGVGATAADGRMTRSKSRRLTVG